MKFTSLKCLLPLLPLLPLGWLGWPVLSGVYENNPDYGHAYLVLALSAWVFWQRLRQGVPQDARGSWFGFLPLVLGLLFFCAGLWYWLALFRYGLGGVFLIALGWVLALWGTILVLGGAVLFRLLLFPLAYLLFAVPLPASWTNLVLIPMKSWVTSGAQALFQFIQMPVYREGFVLHLAGISLGVADACSGMRSLTMLLAVAVAVGYLFRLSGRQTLMLALPAPLLAVGTNILRVWITGVLGVCVDQVWTEGWRHELVGWLGFSVALALLLCQASLQKGARSKDVTEWSRTAPVPFSPMKGAVAGGCLFAALILGLAIDRHYQVSWDEDLNRRHLVGLPLSLETYTASGEGTFYEIQLEAIQPSDRVSRIYKAPNRKSVHFWSLYWAPYQGRNPARLGPHTPDSCMPAVGWQPRLAEEAGPDFPVLAGQKPRIRLFEKYGEKRLVLFWRKSRSGDDFQDFDWSAEGLWKKAKASWLESVPTAEEQFLVVLETELDTSLAEGLDLLQNFANEMIPHLPNHGIGIKWGMPMTCYPNFGPLDKLGSAISGSASSRY